MWWAHVVMSALAEFGEGGGPVCRGVYLACRATPSWGVGVISAETCRVSGRPGIGIAHETWCFWLRLVFGWGQIDVASLRVRRMRSCVPWR